MANALQAKTVAFLAAAEGAEQSELVSPWEAVTAEGGRPVLVSPAFFDSGKPVAAICHAPWTLIEADVVRGRTLTSWPSLQTDLRNAGATWVDEQVVTCTQGPNVLVTSRKPDDLSAFCDAMTSEFAK
jgi:protease I